MEIYIHIGYPKTGSSAIQSHLFSNQQWLRQRGIFIPQSGYASGVGHSFLFGKSDTQEIPVGIAYCLGQESKLPQLRDELAQSESEGYNVALISWEGMPMASEEMLRRLGDALAGHQLIVLAYLREQSRLFQSAFLHGLSKQRAPQRLFFGAEDLSQITPPYLNFYATLDRWKNLPRHTVQIRTRLFEPQLLKSRDVVTDFLDWLGLEKDGHFSWQRDEVNTSIDVFSGAVLELARAAGMDQKGQLRLSLALSSALTPESTKAKDFLPSAAKKYIRDHYRDSNSELLAQHPPENLPADRHSTLFEYKADSGEPQDNEAFHFFKTAYESLAHPLRRVWQGNVRVGHQLAAITGQRESGWRGSEDDGIWSIGPQSTIAFRLPQTDAEAGPSAIELTIAGQYLREGQTSGVRCNGTEEQLDIGHQLLRIPLDNASRTEGICLTLNHELPGTTTTDPQPNDQLFFKLQYLSYDFIWE